MSFLIFDWGNKAQRGHASFPSTAQLGLDAHLRTWSPIPGLFRLKQSSDGTSQWAWNENRGSLYLKTETDFSFNLHYFFHFHASLNCLGLVGPRCSSVKLSEKGNFKEFPAALQQNGLLLPPPFPQEEKKVSSRLPLFCLIQIFPKAFLPPLGNLKWHVRSSLSFLTWLFWISLDSSLCREDPQNT